MNICEQFVLFETAKMLKEAGFREHCRCMYFPDKDGSHKICQNIIADYNVTDDEKYEAGDYYGYGDCYLAPTQALAARWLREARHYVICAWLAVEEKKWFYAYGDTDDMFLTYDYAISDAIYDTYEEAMEAGLKNCLELIKK